MSRGENQSLLLLPLFEDFEHFPLKIGLVDCPYPHHCGIPVLVNVGLDQPARPSSLTKCLELCLGQQDVYQLVALGQSARSLLLRSVALGLGKVA